MAQGKMQILSEVEQLLHDKNYLEAWYKLQIVDLTSFSREGYGKWCLLYAEASIKVGNYNIHDHIDKAIEIFRHSQDTDNFAKAKFLKGWCYSLLGNHLLAEEVFIEAYVNYLRTNNQRGLVRVLNYLSYCSLQTGKIQSAISNLNKCIDVYKDISDKKNVIAVSMNLAALYLRAGRLNDSLSKYNEIQKNVLQQGENNIIVYFYTSAIPYALKGNIETARETIAKVEPYIDKFIRDKAIYYENLGLIHILDRKYDAAEKALTAGLEISLEIAPESALVAQIKRLFGDLYVATRKYHLAEQFATEALAVAEQINERVEVAACWRILAQVEESRNNLIKSQEYYRKAINLLQTIDSRYELAVTRYLAATSGMFDNNSRTAMLYLAQEYFESEGVQPYIAKVAEAMRKSPLRVPFRKPVQTVAPPVVITRNDTMKEILALAERIAQTTANVLLTGETGTGKDLLASYIHYHSGRQGQFVTVNAAAVPTDMVEAELFGHTANAFTGAKRERIGLFAEADGGTFYLNEVADASLEFQAKLLEVLETRKVRRLGENEVREIDFRLIAATNHNIEERVNDGKFRADLYHRLKEIPIHLPPLRDRMEDVPELVKHFLTFAGFDLVNGNRRNIERLGELLKYRYWQGNVRELQAEVRRLWVTANSNISRMLTLAIESQPAGEREELLLALHETGWNRREAARQLGLSEATIRYRIKKYGLEVFCR